MTSSSPQNNHSLDESSFSPSVRDNILIALLVIASLSLNIFFGEKILAGGGLGYDGQTYSRITRNFFSLASERNFPPVLVGRILPSAIVATGLEILNYETSDRNIILGHELVNNFALFLLALCWCATAGELKLSRRAKYLGVVALFLNFRVVKSILFVPIHTDPLAYCLGGFLFFSYLRNNLTGMMLSSVAGSFTWPTFSYLSYFLILFPRIPDGKALSKPLPFGTPLAIAFGAGISLWIATMIYLRPGIFPAANIPLLGLSSLAIFALLTGTVHVLLERFPTHKPWQGGIPQFFVRLTAILTIHVLCSRLQLWLSHGKMGDMLGYYFKEVLPESARFPLDFLMQNILFFGPSLIVCVFFWKGIATTAREFGIGVVVALIYSIFTLLANHPRPITPAFFMLVSLLLVTVERSGLTGPISSLFICLSILMSGIWLSLNYGLDEFTSNFFDFTSYPLRYQVITWAFCWTAIEYILMSIYLAIVFFYVKIFHLNKYVYSGEGCYSLRQSWKE